ncbi:hypothetical protein [Brevibacterium litoralis]|uniref:hypothetical protein n=1 Tax=Brevibacterium litoralis TaxID=3138935 RepID=UPI0032ED5038
MIARVTLLEPDGTCREGTATALGDGRLVLGPEADTAVPRLPGLVARGLTDHHVHLHLLDAEALRAGALLRGGLRRVVDLGGDPATLTDLRVPGALPGTTVLHSGAFLTAPGGYPVDRDWAPAATYRELTGPEEAAPVVAEMAAAGASAVKIAANAAAGPLLGDDTHRAVVAAARTRGLPVVVHAEGPGVVSHVARLGVDRFAHTPHSEVLPADLVEYLAGSTTWISTLDIHGWGDPTTEHGIAVENLRRFHTAGGIVRYGTDLGNGPLPLGLDTREIEGLHAAGLDAAAVFAALSPAPFTEDDPPGTPAVWLPRASPTHADVTGAERLTAAILEGETHR